MNLKMSYCKTGAAKFEECTIRYGPTRRLQQQVLGSDERGLATDSAGPQRPEPDEPEPNQTEMRYIDRMAVWPLASGGACCGA